MTPYKTPEDRFENLKEYPFEPHFHSWQGLDQHFLDEGGRDGPVMLLLHGMPTWSYLYRRMIPPLTLAGYRCIAPDHIGFGNSDKILDDNWYSIEKHCNALTSLIEDEDLTRITLVCQDWGGPIGLRQVTDMPERFERLIVMNTWLHSDFHEYSEGIRNWNAAWHPGGRFYDTNPCGELMKNYVSNFEGSTLTPEEALRAYDAPFPTMESRAGPRRFPLSIPFDNPEGGNAAQQERCFAAMDTWQMPKHFIWGCSDNVFTEAWGEKWSSRYPGATLDKIPEAGHFLQETHAREIVDIMLRRIG
ncbi:MAG: alpha/beta fold hydrolase [Pseudomonadales bacterium]|nr:alpha/beta fold hydrolase [Pseudomonadales bacterium]